MWTVPELVFERKELIPKLQHLPTGVSGMSMSCNFTLDPFT